MATPKRITKEQAEANKKKQQILRQAGYNIKVDGSWGPWQEKQYRKVISNGGRNPNQSNVGVMALPVAGYGAAQLLEGLGSVSLPSISASSLAMSAPVALTLAGPAYGAYEFSTGRFHQLPTDDKERQERVYSSDATRVNRPIVVSSPRSKSPVISRVIGERYVNPILSREAARSRHLSTADEAVNDSITPILVGTVRTTAPSTPPSQEPENNEDKEKDKEKDKKGNSNSWFKLWEGSGTSGTPKNPNFWRHIRNWGVRVPLYTGVAAPVIDVAGNMASASGEPEGQVHKWKWPLTSKRFSLEKGAWKLIEDAYSTPIDSTRKDTTQVILQSNEVANPVQQLGDTVVPAVRTDDEQITTSTRSQLDSINKAWFGE